MNIDSRNQAVDGQGHSHHRPDTFWIKYQNDVVSQGISVRHAVRYRKWAEKFAKSIKGKPLRDRSGEEIKQFLSELRGRVKSWQVEQAYEALRILYAETLRMPWGAEWTDVVEKPDTDMKKNHQPADVLNEVRNRHKVLFNKFHQVVRVRHYSMRTEQAYEAWAARFLAFHAPVPASKLGTPAVKKFLNHLAVERNVAAGTQKQALNALVFLYEHVQGKKLGDLSGFQKAKRSRKIVLSIKRKMTDINNN